MVLLDKPHGLSSFAALSAVKRAAGTRKVGHTGTLDPFATGLLIALVGPATRAARYFNGLPKRYVTEFTFGAETDTDDHTGCETRTTSLPSAAAVEGALDAFRGTIDQLPPSYSAVHVNGRRAHEIARRGERPQVAMRTVTVHELTVREIDASSDGVRVLELEIACSAGTYIRSIARDLGRAVGSAAHVSRLRRTEIGPFRVEEAVTDRELALPRDALDPAEVLCRLDQVRCVPVDEQTAARASQGKTIEARDLGRPHATEPDEERPTLVLTVDGRAVSVGRLDNGRFVYEMVFASGERR